MLQAFPDAPLIISQGSMPTVNAPLPQTNGFGTYSYGDYPTFHARQTWVTTALQSAACSGPYEPRPPNANAWLFADRGFHVSSTSPVSSSSASSVPSLTSTVFSPRQMGVSATGNPTFTTFRPSQMSASATGCYGARMNRESTTRMPIQDTFQFLDETTQNSRGDRSMLYTAKSIPQATISKYAVLGRIQGTGNSISASDALESIASLIEAEPLPSRAQTISELRMKAVEHVCAAFDALKRTGSVLRDIAMSNDDSASVEARAEEAAGLLMGLIKLGAMKPGDLTIPVKIILESDRRYIYLAKALLESGKNLLFNYTTVKWLQSMATDLHDAEDIKNIIGQIKTPPRPHRYYRTTPLRRCERNPRN